MHHATTRIRGPLNLAYFPCEDEFRGLGVLELTLGSSEFVLYGLTPEDFDSLGQQLLGFARDLREHLEAGLLPAGVRVADHTLDPFA